MRSTRSQVEHLESACLQVSRILSGKAEDQPGGASSGTPPIPENLAEEIRFVEGSLFALVGQLREMLDDSRKTDAAEAPAGPRKARPDGEGEPGLMVDDIGGLPGPASLQKFLNTAVPAQDGSAMCGVVVLRSLGRITGWFGRPGVRFTHEFFGQALAQIVPGTIQLFAAAEGCYVLISLGGEDASFFSNDLRTFCAHSLPVSLDVAGRCALVNLYPVADYLSIGEDLSAAKIMEFAQSFARRFNP